MTSTDLVQRISARFAIDADISDEVVREIVRALSEALLRGRHVEIRGFGSFDLVAEPKHNWNGPTTSGSASASNEFELRFKAGNHLRSRLAPTECSGQES